MRRLQNRYPPYDGTEPYIYFAFSEPDIKKAEKILRIMTARGCRVWYCSGVSENSDELQRRQKMAEGADLTVLYLSNSACSDSDMKNNVLINQSLGKRIICIDPDDEDRRLMMGLYEDIPHIPLYLLHGSGDIDNALIHADGFSHEMIGEPLKRNSGIIGKLSVFLFSFAVILTATFFAGYRYLSHSSQALRDEVAVHDQVLLSAIRSAANGRHISSDLLSEITFLELDGIPESWEELSLMPSLERISVPQQALLNNEVIPDGNYTIVLSGGLS